MDYENMSDFEVNTLVAEALGCTIHGKRNGNPIIDSITGKEFAPCNNPSDAWSIILENRISIMSQGGIWLAVTKDFECTHEKAMRAAMIVYLMMQESVNETQS